MHNKPITRKKEDLRKKKNGTTNPSKERKRKGI